MRTQIEGWGWTQGWTPTSPLANSPVGFSGSQVAFVDRGAGVDRPGHYDFHFGLWLRIEDPGPRSI
jgi:hypothetical protein